MSLSGQEFDAVVFLTDYTAFPDGVNSYNIKLCGKSILDWLTGSLGGAAFAVVPYDAGTDIYAELAGRISTARKTFVLFSDTPLLRRATLLLAVESMDKTGAAALKLPRGYLIDNRKRGEIENLEAAAPVTFGEADGDFLIVSDYKKLECAGRVLKERIIEYHQGNGVYITDKNTVFIDADVVIDKGVTVWHGNTLRGACFIEKGALLKEGNTVEASKIGENAVLHKSVLESAVVGAGAKIGPYAHLRPGSVIGRDARIGNYVEVKNSHIGEGTKASHLTYIGDAFIERDCNVGCGVTVANYDGKNKHKTYVGESAFIGSNSCLIAPLTIGERALVAAGSTVTEDVPAGALAVGRARQVNKENLAKKFLD